MFVQSKLKDTDPNYRLRLDPCHALPQLGLLTRFESGPSVSVSIISHLSGRKVGRGLFGKCKSSSAHGRTSRSASASVTWVIVCMMMTMISTAVVDLRVVMVVGVLIVVDVQ